MVDGGGGGSGPSLRPEARVVRVRSGEDRGEARERGSSCLTRVTAAPPPPASRSSSGLIGCSVPRKAGPGPGSVSWSGVASKYFCYNRYNFCV